MIGPIKVVREFIKCQDRCAAPHLRDEAFTYFTRMIDTRRGPESEHGDIIATMGVIHGMFQKSNSHFEQALHHALNGFEVLLVDLKGFGYASGIRSAHWSPIDMHEWLAVVLLQARTDKPLFLCAHSMGCLVTATFLLKNPNLKISGIIYSAPFFGFHPLSGITPFSRIGLTLASLGAEVSTPSIFPTQI